MSDSLNVLTTCVSAKFYVVWNNTVGDEVEVSEGRIKTAKTKVKTVSIAQLLLDCLRLGNLNQSLSSSIKGLSY